MADLRPTQNLCRDIEALSQNPHWQSVIEFLKAREITLAYEACQERDEVQARWIQGRVQELSAFLEQVRNARANLESYSKPQPDVSGVL
jgi:hypothetical protein